MLFLSPWPFWGSLVCPQRAHRDTSALARPTHASKVFMLVSIWSTYDAGGREVGRKNESESGPQSEVTGPHPHRGIACLAVVVAGSAALAQSHFAGHSFAQAFLIGLAGPLSAYVLAYGYQRSLPERIGGPLLGDCGPNPRAFSNQLRGIVIILITSLWVIAWVLMLLGTASESGASDRLVRHMRVILPLMVLLFGGKGLFWLIVGLGRFQVRERGLWIFCILIPWARVDVWRWEFRWLSTSTMLILGGYGPGFFRTNKVRVSPHYRDTADAHMKRFAASREASAAETQGPGPALP